MQIIAEIYFKEVFYMTNAQNNKKMKQEMNMRDFFKMNIQDNIFYFYTFKLIRSVSLKKILYEIQFIIILRGVIVNDYEIIQKWKAGLTKNKLAEIYRRQFNQQIRIIRSSMRHRHDGKFITNYESLAHVEKIIYKYLKNNNK